jgi:hypothetical protein
MYTPIGAIVWRAAGNKLSAYTSMRNAPVQQVELLLKSEINDQMCEFVSKLFVSDAGICLQFAAHRWCFE